MKRLYRDMNESKITGVCSGLGDYFEKDPVIFRCNSINLFFVAGPFFYILAWIIMPVKK